MTADDSLGIATESGKTESIDRPVLAVSDAMPDFADWMGQAVRDAGTFDFVRLSSRLGDDATPSFLSAGQSLEAVLARSHRRQRDLGRNSDPHAAPEAAPWPAPWPAPWIAVATSGTPPAPAELAEFRACVGRLALSYAPLLRLNAILVIPAPDFSNCEAGFADVLRTAETVLALPAVLGQVLSIQSGYLKRAP